MPAAATEAAAKDPPGRGRSCELADVFSAYAHQYCRDHPLPPSHLKIIRAVMACRTAALGGHLERCDACGFERPAYNSCRNRHCPKCQMMAKARWIEKRRAELLPVGYFHAVFTIPHEFNPVALCNKKVVFDILFRSVAQTLQDFGADPARGLGGRIGFTAVLHTWDQVLLDHIHLHCLIPGGALSFDSSRWISAREGFLFPVKALSRVFRGKFMQAIKEAFEKGELSFPGKTAALGTRESFARLGRSLWHNEWVVYCKRPFAGPEGVLDYLGRYTHRVAIANHRITAIEDGKVSFAYRDRRHGGKLKEMSITAPEFIRRFLLHVLPDSFMRVRHFGFLANRRRQSDLSRCRELLCHEPSPSEGAEMPTRELLAHLTGVNLDRCPRCGRGTMHVVEHLPPTNAPSHAAARVFSLPPMDSS